MTSGITPAILKPALPAATGSDTAAVAKAAGFSELLDRPGGGRARQSAHSSSASPASAKSEHRHDETTPRDGTGGEVPQPLDGSDKQAAGPRSAVTGTHAPHADKGTDTEEKKGDSENPKHKAVAVDVSAILFGLPGAANTAQSGGGDPSTTSATTAPAGQSAETAATVAGRKGGSPAIANADLKTAMVQSNDNMSADTMASAAKRQSPPHPTSGIPSAPAQGESSTDAATTAQLLSSAKVQGVTVTASATTPAAPPIVTGTPQPTRDGTGKAADTAFSSPGTGADADTAATPSDSAGRPMSVLPARSAGGDTGRNSGTNGHNGGKDPDRPASPALRNAGSTQTAGSAAFTGGGATAPLLGETASSFVSGMGTPQTWAGAMSQAAYMTYAPAMAAPVRSLSIALQPAELGTVTANLHLSGQQLRVDVEVRTEEARQRLSNDADSIVKSLRNLGFDVSHITIRHGGNAIPLAIGAGQTAGQPQGNAAFQASANSGGGHGGTTQGNAGKNNGEQESQIAGARPSGGDGLSRGLYI